MPHRLGPGARVALVAPAGPLRDESELALALDNTRSFGWEPIVGGHAMSRLGYFAGTDLDRAADLNRAIRDPSIDGIWCLRGGYGAMRLLDALDYDALKSRAIPLIGYSDITALHAAVGKRAGVIGFHGPTARHAMTPFCRDSMQRAVVEGRDSCGPAPHAQALRPGHAEGVLAGGNLSLMAALTGTPWFPDLEGALLVLEDVGEAVYRIDRMLRQLMQSGALRGVRGIVFGECTDCPEASDDGARTLIDVITEFADTLRVPCLLGVPIGHIKDQWTIPLGARAVMDADARTVEVVF